MSDLIAQIQMAQRDAGERAVIAHLERTMGALKAEAPRTKQAAQMPEDLKQTEAAARAAGYAFRADVTQIGVWACYVDGHAWNPRDDDGDALRLAVDLRLNIEFGNDGADYTVAWDGVVGSGKWYHHASDRRIATRWAILTVAAMAETQAVGTA